MASFYFEKEKKMRKRIKKKLANRFIRKTLNINYSSRIAKNVERKKEEQYDILNTRHFFLRRKKKNTLAQRKNKK